MCSLGPLNFLYVISDDEAVIGGAALLHVSVPLNIIFDLYFPGRDQSFRSAAAP